MAVTFPSTPTLNQRYTAENGLIYVWDGEKWKTNGSFAADEGQYIIKSGDNTAIYADATNVGVGTLTPTEKLDVEGGYVRAAGGLKIEGGTSGTDGSIYRQTASGTTGSYLVIEEESALLEVGRREASSYYGLNFNATQTSPPVAHVFSANTYLDSTIQGTTNTYGFRLDVTDAITSDTGLYGLSITGAWDTSTAPNSYGAYIDVDTSTTGNDTYQIAAVGSAHSYFMGNVGIGLTQPEAKLEIAGAGEGIILSAPNGTRYRITVANDGTVTSTAV